MAKGAKRSYTAKQKRQAGHIARSYLRRGKKAKRAGEIAWRTVNKQTGGGRRRKAAPA